MTSYRICNTKYKDSLNGVGAKMYGGRWNSVGIPLLYTAEHISLAALEILVNVHSNEIPKNLCVSKFQFLETALIKTIYKTKLKADWKLDISYSRFIGDSFVKDNHYTILKVPSAVIDDEYNFILNPMHKNFNSLQKISSNSFLFDKRLFLQT